MKHANTQTLTADNRDRNKDQNSQDTDQWAIAEPPSVTLKKFNHKLGD